MAMGCVFLRLGSVQIDDLRGIAKRMPLTMAAFVVGGVGLIGVPMTVGFVSKWYLILAALERGMWPVAAIVLLSSLIALAYVWRVIEAAYFHEPAEKYAHVREAPLSMLIPMWVLALASIWFGISTERTVGLAARAAEALLGLAS
jgi:multicomponent Na+:H+ antiporter subunit D